ncbi:MAG: hypothetical protein Kow0025_11180 [Thermodesulfovibrionales bacterium]
MKRPLAPFLLFTALALALWACTARPEHPRAPVSGDAVTIALSEVRGRGAPVFYSLAHEDREIGFFVVETSRGFESYFDACAKCYPKKMGYSAGGGTLKCRACGLTYPVESLGRAGSCYPLPLKGRVEGESYVIDREDLIRGARYF